ncbi:lipopolysaccharide biosynthesis protein [Flavobacterium paronense]|uniref:Lipopolysaccharide biosynthesis protein n=1 Tax=Flavobacterium paronense TaxID=1392775 RepID=A0ABV5GFF0_9FLAO|nr:lipopolysaccharide biosynthesis protein [Flavobacterium paronense]MDN3676048.1 lipopolysaccharide biosynthesis protein [Flavobacterium paronense]
MEINPNTDEELSIKEIVIRGKGFWEYIVSRRKTVYKAMLVGAILGLAYSSIKQPEYSASLSFALEDKSSGGMNSLSIDSPFGIDLVGGGNGGAFSSSNLPELFMSRNMVERTLLTPVLFEKKKISLAEMYIQNKGWRKIWNENPQLKSIQFLPNSNRSGFTRVNDSILGIIYEDLSKTDLTVSQKDKKNGIIYINAKSTNELFAKYFTEALAKQVSDFYIDYKSKKARENVSILMKQTDSIRGELNSAITGVAVSVDNTFNLNPALNIKRASTSRRQVDVQANTVILTELVKQTELAKVALRKETPLIQVIDSPILPLKKDKVGIMSGVILGSLIALFLSLLFIVLKNIFKQILE